MKIRVRQKPIGAKESVEHVITVTTKSFKLAVKAIRKLGFTGDIMGEVK